MNTNINLTTAKKVLDTIDAGLVAGLGNPVPGQMCVEAAVCFALGLPHGDDPGCVSESVRKLKILLNDGLWSSNQARAQGLRRLGLAQLGTKDTLDEFLFAKKVTLLVVRTTLADCLDLIGLKTEALSCQTATDLKTARAAAGAAVVAATRAAVAAAGPAYAADAAASAADAAARAARDAAYAAATYAGAARATGAAAYTATRAAVAAQRAGYSSDALLSTFAEGVVQILIEMKSPGCEFLPLTETL